MGNLPEDCSNTERMYSNLPDLSSIEAVESKSAVYRENLRFGGFGVDSGHVPSLTLGYTHRQARRRLAMPTKIDSHLFCTRVRKYSNMNGYTTLHNTFE